MNIQAYSETGNTWIKELTGAVRQDGPSWFGSDQRADLIRLAAINGLDCVRVIANPEVGASSRELFDADGFWVGSLLEAAGLCCVHTSTDGLQGRHLSTFQLA